MIIRHLETDAGPENNCFVAYDDLEEEIGEASVVETMADMLCPSRPHHLLVRTQCRQEAQDALLGAATARAMLLARMTPDAAARIYAECPPDDEARMAALKLLGFRDDDGLVRMRKTLVRGPITKPLPAGCTIVRDYRLDELEQRYFLERYNAMFARSKDMAWLKAVRGMPDFARVLVISRDGLAGEMLTWSDNDVAVVGIIQTTPAWQRKGVGSYLMEYARIYWLDTGLKSAYFDVWTRLTGAVRLAATSGFRPAETLMRYPGIDIG